MDKANINIPKTETGIRPAEILFYPDKATLLLAVDSRSVNMETKKTAAEKMDLLPKTEFHLTIIGSDTGEEIMRGLETRPVSERERMISEIARLGKSIDWKITLNNDCYHIQKDYDDPDPADPNTTIPETRRSIIQSAEIQGLEEFYQKLNLLLEKDFPIPSPHLTLYTNSTREDKKLRGIGVYSRKQFEDLGPVRV